jgi:hypothetical protein
MLFDVTLKEGNETLIRTSASFPPALRTVTMQKVVKSCCTAKKDGWHLYAKGLLIPKLAPRPHADIMRLE